MKNVVIFVQTIINNSDLEKKIETLSTKAELKEKQDKITKLQTYDWGLFS